MAFVDRDSCECAKSECELFSVPPTQTSIESCTMVEFHPVSSIVHGLPIEFNVGGSGQDYIDLANTLLYIRAKITRANGEDIDNNDVVAPINLTLHSMFSEMELKLNDTLVSSLDSTYAYRAYLETLLSYSTEAKKSQLTASMYYKDTAGSLDILALDGAGATNLGLIKRHSYFAESNEVDMVGRLHVDLAFQERLIPSDVGLKLKLQRSKDSFALMAPGNNPTFKLQIAECKLLVRKVRVTPSVYIGHAKQLEVENAKYPITRVVCKTFTVSAGNLNIVQESLFSGQLPIRLFIAAVDNDAFNGAYGKNPFNFKHLDLTHLKVFLDGTQQHIKPLDVDYTADSPQFVQAYLTLFEGTGKFGKDEGIDLARDEYNRGFTLYGFDLTPDQSERDHLNLQREGSVRIEARFKTALPNTINVVVYAEFENFVYIDKHRNVIYDYSK